jgi:hypothetical protein
MNESIIVKRPLRKPRLAEGVYPSEIIAVEELKSVLTPWGEKDMIAFKFDLEGVEISYRCTKSLHRSSNLYALIKELAGEPGEEFDVSTLIGTPCTVFISHYETDAGDVWENIEKITKGSKSAPSTLENTTYGRNGKENLK